MMNNPFTILAVLLLAPLRALSADDTPPPNILWISLEDINPMLGCYGDAYARTPNIDSLAASAIRYGNAHAPGVVCSPTRTAVITGMYPSSIGAMHHRSMVKPPKFLRMFPHYLWYPMERAIKVINGDTTFYRWSER